MTLVTKAHNLLYPQTDPSHIFSLKYSAKFKDFNANVKYTKTHMHFSLSRSWHGVDEDIQIGLIQSLLNRINKTSIQSIHIDLYTLYMKNLHVGTPKTKQEPALLDSFNRVNEKMFNCEIEAPNLVWGTDSTRKLGCYTYGNDTISISTILRDHPELLDYVMHHEMLHKKLKFETTGKTTRYHTPEFRALERAYPGSQMLEKQLSRLATKKKILKSFF